MDSVEHWAVVKISSLLLPIFRKISRNWPLRRTRTKWTIFSNSRLVNSGEIAIVDCPYITNWLSRAYSFSRSEIIRRSIPQWHSWQIWMVKAGTEINDSDWLNKDKILLRGIPAWDHMMVSFEKMRLNLVFIEEWQRCLWYRVLRSGAVRTVAYFYVGVVLRRCVSFVYDSYTCLY